MPQDKYESRDEYYPILNKEQLGQEILKTHARTAQEKDIYEELISDDIAKAFLSYDDYELYLDMCGYCETVKSFGRRYEINLKPHYNHYAHTVSYMVVGSGSVEGQRVTLAKTDIAKTISHQESIQSLQEKSKRDSTDLFGEIAKRI